MSFLKKIFGRSKTGELRRRHVDRAPRVRILPLHNIRFDETEPYGHRNILIANISFSGVGFIRTSAPTWPAQGEVLRGVFFFQGGSQDAVMRVAHVSPSLVGCFFDQQTDALRKLVDTVFRLELQALRMFRVNPELLRAETDGQPHLFRGDNNCELFYVELAGKIIRFTLNFLGSYLEWADGQELRSGAIVADSDSGNWGYQAVDPIRWEKVMSSQSIQEVTKFLENIDTLPPAHRQQLIRVLQPS